TVAVDGRSPVGYVVVGQQVEPAAGHPLVVLGHDDRFTALQEGTDAAGPGRSNGVGFILGLVADEHPLVVPENDRVVRGGHQVVGHERDLAATVGAIDHVGGDAQPRHV